MGPPPDEIGALAEQIAELAAILDRLADGDWRRPTPCTGWDVADVVLHLAQTNELAAGSLAGRYGEVVAGLASDLPPARDVDDGAAAMVARQRGADPASVEGRWRRSADALLDHARRADAHERVEWVAGRLSARTLVTTRLAETWIHTGDVADAVGAPLVPGDRLRHVARLAWRTLPYAFSRAGRPLHGPVSFQLTGPTGAAWDLAPAEPPATVVEGPGVELCLVAGRRLQPASTSLVARGPDAEAVLELVRTYA